MAGEGRFGMEERWYAGWENTYWVCPCGERNAGELQRCGACGEHKDGATEWRGRNIDTGEDEPIQAP